MESSIKIEVRYAETDQMGVVYHANYVIWLDLARTKFLKDLGFEISKLEEDGLMFPVSELEIKYKSSIRFANNVEIKTTVEKFSKIKTSYKHQIYCDGLLAATARTVLAHVSKETFKPINIAKYAPDVFAKYKELDYEDN